MSIYTPELKFSDQELSVLEIYRSFYKKKKSFYMFYKNEEEKLLLTFFKKIDGDCDIAVNYYRKYFKIISLFRDYHDWDCGRDGKHSTRTRDLYNFIDEFIKFQNEGVLTDTVSRILTGCKYTFNNSKYKQFNYAYVNIRKINKAKFDMYQKMFLT